MSQTTTKEKNTVQNIQQEETMKNKMKRYNLVLPNSLFDEVQAMANQGNTSVLELLKRFIKIGLVVTKLYQSSDVRLIIREGDKERELVLL